MKKIAIFGDSFVEGVGDTEKGGWAYRLKDTMRSNFDVYIDGLGGRNIIDLKKVIQVFFKNNSADYIIINIGINDSRYRESLSGLEVPPEKFKRIYEEIIDLALQNGASHVIALGLSRVDEDIVFDYKPDKCHTNSNAELLDKEIASLASRKKVIYVPIANMIRTTKSPNTLFDGLHPNSLGHSMIFNAVVTMMIDHDLNS